MKRPNKKEIAGIFTVAALSLVVLESRGYRDFDLPDSRNNILCTLDPACRPLTFGEVALARGLFGDGIDYSSVKVFDRQYMTPEWLLRRSMAPNGNIYMPGNTVRDFSAPGTHQRNFVHEMTHVWQHRGGANLYALVFVTWVQNGFNYDIAYNFNVQGTKRFHALNLEQQAEMIEEYFVARNHVRMKVQENRPLEEVKDACAVLVPFEKRLDGVLPVQREAACTKVKIPQLAGNPVATDPSWYVRPKLAGPG